MNEQVVSYTVKTVPTDRIRRFKNQPREYFDPAEIESRAKSMLTVGQQIPLTVERIEGDPKHDYELIDGEQRWRSLKKAKITHTLVLIRSKAFSSMPEKHLASLVANFNRSEHTPMEISNALQLQITENKMTMTALGLAIGKTVHWVSQYVSLQKLHPDVKAMLDPTIAESKRLAPTIAMTLAAAPANKQMHILKKARRSDGKITLSRVQDAMRGVEGVKTRSTQTPARRRQAAENALRAIGSAGERLSSVPYAEARVIFDQLKDAGEINDIESVDQLLAVLGYEHATMDPRHAFPDLPAIYDGSETPKGRETLAKLHDYWESRIDPNKPFPKTYLEIAYPNRYHHREWKPTKERIWK